MSVLGSLLLALLQPAAASPPVVDVEVEVGLFEPEDFPEMVRLDRRMPNAEMVERVERMFSDGRCTLAGATARRFNIVVPFAIQMEADGTPQSVVVKEAGCVALETLVGQIVLAQLERGDFVPSHTEGERWYVSELGFAMGVEDEAVAISREEPDRMICRQEQPELGSRTRMVRMCKTAAQWRAFAQDREQLRRDIQSNVGCSGASCLSANTSLRDQ